MLETVDKEDCNKSRTGKVRGYKKCFKCGTKDPTRGISLVEVYIPGGNPSHYLCKNCRDAHGYKPSGK